MSHVDLSPILWVAGGRDFQDRAMMSVALEEYDDSWTLITGAARGADQMAEEMWRDLGRRYIGVPADWQRHGRGAGPQRNVLIANVFRPDVLLWFPGGRGTAHAVEVARRLGWSSVVEAR